MLDKLLLILVGLVLFFFGAEGPLVSLMGTETAGVVEAVEVQPRDDATSVRDWKVTYRFQTPDGKSRTGVENRNRVYNTSTLPRVGAPIRVKYLAALPAINLPASQAGLRLAHLGAMALGLGLVALGVLGRRRTGRRIAA